MDGESQPPLESMPGPPASAAPQPSVGDQRTVPPWPQATPITDHPSPPPEAAIAPATPPGAALVPDEEVTRFGTRFQNLQADFIDDPKGVADRARSLLEEFVERMADGLRAHVRAIQPDAAPDTDTERLRLAVRAYRDLLKSLAEARN